MPGITWTTKELTDFDTLLRGLSSLDQVSRVLCRVRLIALKEEYGEAKANAMFKAINGHKNKSLRETLSGS